jgi:hypothetical protein
MKNETAFVTAAICQQLAKSAKCTSAFEVCPL